MVGGFDPDYLACALWFSLVSAVRTPAAAAEPMVEFADESQAIECDALMHAIEVAGAVWQAAGVAGVEVVMLFVVDAVAVRQAESSDVVIGAVASEKLEGIREPPRADRALTQRLLLLRGAQLFVMPRGLLRL